MEQIKNDEKERADIIIDGLQKQMTRAEAENPRQGNDPRCVRGYYLYDVMVLIIYMIRKPDLVQPKKGGNGSDTVRAFHKAD